MSRQGYPSSGHAPPDKQLPGLQYRHSGASPRGNWRRAARPPHLTWCAAWPAAHKYRCRTTMPESPPECAAFRAEADGCFSRSDGGRNHETITLFVTNTDQAVITVRWRCLCRNQGLQHGWLGCHNLSMETPLSPLEFARRTRRLHADREAVVDGDLRLTYRAVLRPLRPLVRGAAGAGRGAVGPGGHDRAEHARAAGVVLRGPADRGGAGADQLPADRRRTSSTSSTTPAPRVVCVASDYLEAVDGVRDRMPERRHFVAFEGRAGRRAGSTTRRRSPPPSPTSRGRRSASGTCSRSTTPAAPRRARRA